MLALFRGLDTEGWVQRVGYVVTGMTTTLFLPVESTVYDGHGAVLKEGYINVAASLFSNDVLTKRSFVSRRSQ